jgi:hypothetical protein
MKPMTRRSVLTAAVALAAAASVDLRGVLAQSATPGAAAVPADLSGYPALAASITDKGYDLSTATVPSGLVLLTVTNNSSAPTGAAVLGPGKGQTMDELQAAAATPTADEGFPPFLYQAAILGGPGELQPGSTGYALLNIPAGDWVVFGEGQQPPTPFKSVEGGGNATEPKADVDVLLADFTFNGLDKLTAGDSLWKVSNKGAQPHMMVIIQVPAGTTEDQVMAAVMSDGNGTPQPGGLSPDKIKNSKNGVLLLSTMQTMWLPVTFDAGTYTALCFVTDPSNGQPHAMEGMVKLFTVS